MSYPFACFKSMASKEVVKKEPCSKYKAVLGPLQARLEEVIKEKSHVVALQCCLRNQKHTLELQTMLKKRYKHLYTCEVNCRAISGAVCRKQSKRSKSIGSHLKDYNSL